MKDKERRKFIWNRKDIPKKYYSLKKILESKNMQNYYSICSKRILNETEESDEFLYIDVNFNDILLSDDGLFVYSDILMGYLEKEYLLELYRELRETNKNIFEQNLVYEAFRKMTFSDLIKSIKSANTKDFPGHSQKTVNCVKYDLICELFSRNPFNIARIKILDKVML